MTTTADIHPALHTVIDGGDLTAAAMQDVMRALMSGEMTDAQIGGFLVALRMKGETIEEIAAAAAVMREFAEKVPATGEHLVDIVGTGGDGVHTFNISTTAALVVAAAGGRVAKHNNRAISSRSGSADALEQAGVRLGLSPGNIAACIDQVGVGFMFAPAHHPAARYAAGPRRELATRSIFNLLGPLTNPAGVERQLVGVYQPELLDVFAQALQRLGGRHCLVVRSEDGLDEISHAAATRAAELKDGEIKHYQITPRELGIAPGAVDDLVVKSPEESYAVMRGVLDNQPGPALDVTLLNAGAAAYVAGLAPDIGGGIELARDAVAGGAAREKLQALADLTQQLAAQEETA